MTARGVWLALLAGWVAIGLLAAASGAPGACERGACAMLAAAPDVLGDEAAVRDSGSTARATGECPETRGASRRAQMAAKAPRRQRSQPRCETLPDRLGARAANLAGASGRSASRQEAARLRGRYMHLRLGVLLI